LFVYFTVVRMISFLFFLVRLRSNLFAGNGIDPLISQRFLSHLLSVVLKRGISQNDLEWAKMTKNELKWPRMTQNDPKWQNEPKLLKMKNAGRSLFRSKI